MSEEQELQAQSDEEIVKSLRRVMAYQAPRPQHEPFIWAIYGNAALRTIDTLTAERDALRAENARLRAACEGVPELMTRAASNLEREGDYESDPDSVTHALRSSADRLTATLAAPAGDGADGDGERGAE